MDEFKVEYVQRHNIVHAINGTVLKRPFKVESIRRGTFFITLREKDGTSHMFMRGDIASIEYA